MGISRRTFQALLAAIPSFAQNTPPEPEKESSDLVIREFVKLITAPTTVVDKQGHYVNDLKSQEFRLIDSGEVQKIQVDQSYHPVSIVICVQANNTVEPVLPQIKRVAPLIENALLGERGEAAVIAFDHRIRVMEEFTHDGDKIRQALDKIQPGSTTSAMNDAVSKAALMLRHRPAENRKVILLIAETRDKGSQSNTRQALLDLQFGNIVLYSVNINRLITSLLTKQQPNRPSQVPVGAQHLPPGVAATPENVNTYTQRYYGNYTPIFTEIFKQVKSIFVDNQLEAFTKYTGGSERSFLSFRDLERVVQDLADELHSQYIISYSPKTSSDSNYHQIVVEVLRPGLKVRTRDGYWLAPL